MTNINNLIVIAIMIARGYVQNLSKSANFMHSSYKNLLLLLCALLQIEFGHAQDQSEGLKLSSITETCVKNYASNRWLDKSQAVTFTTMCKTVRWFDHLFGKEKAFDDQQFGGKVILGFKNTQRDGFDPKLRVRIKSKLPNASSRMNAFIGRVDEEEFISDSNQHPDSISDAVIRRRIEDESEWLIGLGYSVLYIVGTIATKV